MQLEIRKTPGVVAIETMDYKVVDSIYFDGWIGATGLSLSDDESFLILNDPYRSRYIDIERKVEPEIDKNTLVFKSGWSLCGLLYPNFKHQNQIYYR